MKLLRVYMHPDGDTVVDIGVPDDFNLAIFWNQVKQDGAITAEGALIPTNVIHHVSVIAIAQQPTLTVYAGGKDKLN